MKKLIRGIALLFLLVGASYLPAFRAGFIWDDEAYVINNRTLRSVQGLEAIWTQPSATPQYYPLVHTTFWLEYQAWGLNPAGYHATNIILHACNAGLLFVLLSMLGVPGAWWCAALFAVHPVHVESVAWVTERKNVLSAFFYLAAALAWCRYDGLGTEPARRSLNLYLVSFALFVAALLSKTVTCSLPAAMLLLAWWRRGKLRVSDIVSLLPFFAAGLAGGLMTAWLEQVHTGARGAEWAFTFAERCLIAGRAVLFYLGKLLWPHPLLFMYPRWTIDAGAAAQYLYPATVLAGFALAWWRRAAWGRGAFTAFAFFVGTLFPALGFFNIYPMRYSFVADHFQYLASIGPLALVAAALARHPSARAVGAIAVMLCAGLTWQHTGVFRNAETIWRHTLAGNPTSWMAHNNLGLLLQAQGRTTDALRHYEAAVALKGDAAEALTNIGLIHAMNGDAETALRYHQQAVAADPRSDTAQNNLGMALAQKGQLKQGIEHLRAALALNPYDAGVRANLGNALLLQGDLRGAVAEFRAALSLDPRRMDVVNNLAWILATSGERSLRSPEEAVRLAESAAASPAGRTAGTLDTLAAAYAAAGRYPDAVRVAQEAMEKAQASGDTATAAKIGERIKLYSAGKAYFWER